MGGGGKKKKKKAEINNITPKSLPQHVTNKSISLTQNTDIATHVGNKQNKG